ncbi:hypothetical protein Agub_g1240 [Astrephomene gubernaculifera]|uniref:Kinesin motor domain-containing protein n=1 Tax=Astrephomene gubernaculifera TaxID=47775 RepID=A0AAD3HHK8_9CHLO|nr:hypothetical protein Agub_g1240 [Astrephomene gubernaculifera]
MADSPQPAEESNVCVAVKIRPLSPTELDDGCRESLFVTPGLPQVSTGQHNFTYDYVFGEGGTFPDSLYVKCVGPLVDGLFRGYNATVFAYGQTGSGKTYTMGSEYKPGGKCRGVIPDTINDIFTRVEAIKDRAVTVRVCFVEIHKEEVKDLLLPSSSGPRPAVTIREMQNGGVALYGAVEKEVRSREEMAEVLEMGTLCRSTGSTNMNNRSSRSHAIFSITLEQRRQVQLPTTPTPNADATGTQGGDEDGEEDEEASGEEGEALEDFLVAKMHLVDLAGSERAKRTKAEGARLREGIHINRGLLALGNVINAIVDNHKHVPYRDSKLTRLLQDSLGGNSRTVMIACVSPADSNFEETLNTLRYADRARHIRNKPVVNRDPVAAQLAVLRNTIAQLKSENMSLKRALTASGNEGAVADALAGHSGGTGLGTSALESVIERLTQEVDAHEAEIFRLNADKEELRRELAAVTDKWHTAQAQCDLLQMNLAACSRHASQGGVGGSEDTPMTPGGGAVPLPSLDIVKGYVARISELETELKSMKSLASHLSYTRRRGHASEHRTPGGMSDTEGHGTSPLRSESHVGGADGEADEDPASDQHPELAAEEEYFMAELAAHTLNQEKMKKEVALLQRQLEAKERKMVELMKNTGSMPALKQHYDRVLAELESQRDTLVAERKALMDKLAAASAASEEERKRLEASYRERIQQYDERLKEVRKKERDYIAMQKLKQRTEEAHRRLSADIQRLKQQKVSMQRQLEANAKNFAAWRQQREKELAQLRKQSRKDRATIQHLEAMQAKQNAVLQRKISDANAARKRIKELQEAVNRRTAAATTAASQQQAAAAAAQQQAFGGNVEIQPNVQAPVLRTDKDRREWLLKELELCNMSCEFRKVIEGELAQRAEASRKLRDLEKRLTLLDQLQPASPVLMAGGASAVMPVSPGLAAAAGALAAGPEAREKLMAKRKELEDKLAYHNAQISDLQAQWERQKAEEESRGGGAMDVRRWAGLRNVVECRELLRTLFRLSVETKSFSNDLTVDLCRCTEEADVLRVQLEGAQKKCAQYRRVAAAMQAAAAGVMSVPHHNGVSAQDETDKQVDAVLEELHVVRINTPAAAKAANTREPAAGEAASGTPAGASTGADGGGDMDIEMEDVEMDDVRSPDRPNDAARALNFLSPVPPNTGRREMSRQEAPGAAPQRYSPEIVGNESEDDEEDKAWPEVPETNVAVRKRRSGAGSGGGNGEISAGGAKPIKVEMSASARAAAEEAHFSSPTLQGFTFSPHFPASGNGGPAASTSPPIRTQSPSQTPSFRRSTSNNNMGPWARSSLVQPTSARQYTTWASSLRSSCTLPVSNAGDIAPGPAGLARSGSSLGSMPRAAHLAVDSGASNKRLQAWISPANNGQGASLTAAAPSDSKVSGALRESMDYRAAMMSGLQHSQSPCIVRQPQHAPITMVSPRASAVTPPQQLMRNSSKSTGTIWSPRSSARASHENMQPGSTPGSGNAMSTAGSGKGTPLANHYKEKAAAARERNTVLRVSMQRNLEHLESPQQPRFAGGLGDATGGRLTFAGATGAVVSSLDSSRAGGVFRDSGAAAAGQKQQKAIWR